jgi:type I restriction enzyme S subunit
MIGDLKPYGEYKDTGLPWLGQVPAHWALIRIKTVLRETDRRSDEYSETLLSLTRVRGLIPHREMTDKVHGAKTLVGYKRYNAGQLVMNRMQAWSGMFGSGPIDGLVSPDYAVFDVLGGHDANFILERLKTPDLVGQFTIESKGIGSGFNRLYTNRFGAISVSLPSPDEQTAIVQFLDWATGRLERAIKAKRKVIALLNEQKQAIIYRAVTRGLDPSVLLKSSGTPWLGDIPQHWDVARPKQVLKSRSGGAVAIKNTASQERRQGYVPAFSASGQDVWLPRPMFHGSGLVLSAVGARCGKTFKASGEWAVVANTHAFMVPEPHSSDYWWYVTNTKDWWVRSGSAQPFVQVSDSLNRKWVLPPTVEQKAIAAFLDKEVLRFETAVSQLEREIGLLREYRTRLVADVVTGKIDVREAAARLPEEVPQDTVKDDADLGEDLDIADEEATA